VSALIRIESILENPDYLEYLSKTEKHETDRIYCGHGFQHLLDVARISYIVMQETGEINRFKQENCFNTDVVKEIVYASAFLHDIGRFRQYETGEDHAEASASLAPELLIRAGFTDKETDIIVQAIREHRHYSEDNSLLGRMLFRGDKLSRLCSRCDAKNECNKHKKMETGIRAIVL
jgi:uncharacterized protein